MNLSKTNPGESYCNKSRLISRGGIKSGGIYNKTLTIGSFFYFVGSHPLLGRLSLCHTDSDSTRGHRLDQAA